MCQQCDRFEAEKQRLTELAKQNVLPCLVCNNPDVVAIGTWIPGLKTLLAAGGNETFTPVFCFWLCMTHAPITPENDKAIQHAVLRERRTGRRFNVKGD